jgi:DNA-directed RNA polymerase specialized sigma24 family protein
VGFVDIVDPGLMAAVRSLPDRQREVVALRVLLGLSADQTADVLSINVGTVSTHLRRGLVRALRRCVEPDAATRHRNR